MAQQVKGWTCLAQMLILKWGDGGRRQGNIHCQGHRPPNSRPASPENNSIFSPPSRVCQGMFTGN